MSFQDVKGWEFFLQFVFTVPTNLAMLPGCIAAWRMGLPIDCVLGLFTMTTSTLYHLLQALRVRFLGGNDGRWHVADNVFAITTFCFVPLNFMQPTDPRVFDALKLSVLSVNIVSQCIRPWDTRYTLYPIAFVFLMALGYRLSLRSLPKVSKRWAVVSVVAFFVAAYFFIKGLDDDFDYCRINHGLWHLSVGFLGYSALRTFHPDSIVVVRNDFHSRLHQKMAVAVGTPFSSKREVAPRDYTPPDDHDTPRDVNDEARRVEGGVEWRRRLLESPALDTVVVRT